MFLHFNKSKKGFTLIELVVVIGIFGLIMSVALFNQSKLSSSTLLTNLAYETALALRQAQTYGIGVTSVSGVNGFSGGFGVHFSSSLPNQFIIFKDTDGSKTYSPPTGGTYPVTDQNITVYSIAGGNKITGLCYTDSSGPPAHCGQTSVDVVFTRPDPEAFITLGGLNPTGQSQASAQIMVSTPTGDKTKTVDVEYSGQIGVQ